MIASKWRYTLELDGQPLELPEGEILLGRSRSCTVTLPDPSISRQHAKLVLRHGQVRLRDLNSSNGTYLNDARVHTETDVVDGDRIVLGETEMRFHAAAPEGKSAPTQGVAPAPAAGPEAAEEDAPTERRIPGAGQPSRETTPARPAAVDPRPGSSSAVPRAPAGELLPSLGALDTPSASKVAGPRAAAKRPAAAAQRPGGFWIRTAAILLDSLWLGALTGLAALLPFLLDASASLASASMAGAGLLGALVIVVGWAKWGTTPGKRLLGLYIHPLDGPAPLGLGRAVLRFVGYLVSSALLGVGFLLVAFSKDKRGLHDLIAGTSVSRR